MSRNQYAIIGRVTQPDETQILTIQQAVPPVSGHWTAVITTDGVSDRIIAPSGRFLQIEGMPRTAEQETSIPEDLWFFLAEHV